MVQPYLSRMNTQGSLVDQLRSCFEDATDLTSVMVPVKEVLSRHRERIRMWNSAGASGSDTVRDLCEMVDTLIRVIWDHVEINIPADDEYIAIVAVGGFGRMELCPQSDIDLLVLTSNNPTQQELKQAELVVRTLWDYGFVVGSSVHSVNECEAAVIQSPETWTSFLNERFLAGNHNIYRRFVKVTRKPTFPWRISSLIEAKVRERVNRKHQLGDLVQHLEPNIKEGNGCLRDVHALMWVAKVKHDCNDFQDLVREGLITPQELEDLRAGYDFLLRVRCCLHFITNRKDDHLTFHLQPEVAEEFGFQGEDNLKPVEVFLKVFYRHTRNINRITSVIINRWLMPRRRGYQRDVLRKHPHFQAVGGVLDLKVQVGNPFVDNPRLVLEFFDLANSEGYTWEHHAYMRIQHAVHRLNPEDTERRDLLLYFLDLCKRRQRVGRTLRAMNDVEFIGVIIPDFKRIYCHSQHDIYHIYTTDEHTLSVVRTLAYLPNDKELVVQSISKALSLVMDMDVLVLACFFHDIGKGVGSNHSVTGSQMVFDFMEKMGFAPARCKEASQLVLHHLLLNETIQRRDLDDPRTIRQVVAKIESPVTLHKLYVLTYCDVSSVHPDAWSGWKATLLKKLYEKALEEFLRPFQAVERKERKDTLIVSASTQVSQDEVAYHLSMLPERYASSVNPEEMVEHIRLVRELGDTHPMRISLEPRKTHWETVVVARDDERLLARVTGAFSRFHLNILSARIFTRMDGVAIDIFQLSIPEHDRNPQDWERRLEKEARLAFELDADAHHDRQVEVLVKPRMRLKTLPTQMPMKAILTFSNELSDSYTTLDLTCKDQLGLFYKVAKVFHDFGLKVHGAILTTEADKAMDSFYITHKDGLKIMDQELIREVIQKMETELSTR